MNALDPEQFADGVEEDVAGSDDGLVDIDRTVPLRAPAMEDATVEFRVTWTVDREVGGNGFGLEHGRGHHNFEHRAGSKLGLNGAIEQRSLQDRY